MKKGNAKKFKLNLRNLIRGAIYSICTSVSVEITVAVASWETYNDINWQRIVMVACGGLFSYLINKFFQNEQGDYTK